MTRGGVADIAATAAASGMSSMRLDGIEKVKAGLTTLVEVGRVTAVI